MASESQTGGYCTLIDYVHGVQPGIDGVAESGEVWPLNSLSAFERDCRTRLHCGAVPVSGGASACQRDTQPLPSGGDLSDRVDFDAARLEQALSMLRSGIDKGGTLVPFFRARCRPAAL